MAMSKLVAPHHVAPLQAKILKPAPPLPGRTRAADVAFLAEFFQRPLFDCAPKSTQRFLVLWSPTWPYKGPPPLAAREGVRGWSSQADALSPTSGRVPRAALPVVTRGAPPSRREARADSLMPRLASLGARSNAANAISAFQLMPKPRAKRLRPAGREWSRIRSTSSA